MADAVFKLTSHKGFCLRRRDVDRAVGFFGPQVMLVSLCAGGVGLNLIGGNHLFLIDMHW